MQQPQEPLTPGAHEDGLVSAFWHSSATKKPLLAKTSQPDRHNPQMFPVPKYCHLSTRSAQDWPWGRRWTLNPCNKGRLIIVGKQSGPLERPLAYAELGCVGKQTQPQDQCHLARGVCSSVTGHLFCMQEVSSSVLGIPGGRARQLHLDPQSASPPPQKQQQNRSSVCKLGME